MMRRRIFWGVMVFVLFFFLTDFVSGGGSVKSDLKVTELTVTRSDTQQVPLRLKVSLRILNTGAPTGAINFITRLSYRMKSSDPWQTLHDFSMGAVSSGGGAHWEKTFDFTQGGSYTFKAEVDADKQVIESSENNNSKTVTKTFDAGTPDLIVKNLNASTVNVASSGAWRVKVEWDVENIGDGKAKGSFVTVLKVSENSGAWNEMQRFTRSNLDKGKSFHFSTQKTFASNVHSLRFQVVTDESHAIHEKGEGNNSAISNTLNRQR